MRPLTDFVTLRSDIITRDQAKGSLARLLGQSREKEAFVFVHGFNNRFEDAAEPNEKGPRLIWVEAAVLARLRTMRRPGESYSEVILRLVEIEAKGRSFNFVYFSSFVSMEVSRLCKGGFFARNARRNPVVIEVVSIGDFPFVQFLPVGLDAS